MRTPSTTTTTCPAAGEGASRAASELASGFSFDERIDELFGNSSPPPAPPPYPADVEPGTDTKPHYTLEQKEDARRTLAEWIAGQQAKGHTAVEITRLLQNKGVDPVEITDAFAAAGERTATQAPPVPAPLPTPAPAKQAAKRRVTKSAPLVFDYYDIARKEFLVRSSGKDWIPFTETQYKRILKSRGVSGTVPEKMHVSPLDEAILFAQDANSVCYAGQLAGWTAGVHTPPCGRILVTKGPNLITPEKGQWKHLQTFFETLFADHPEQLKIFYGWMKIAVESLYGRLFRPGQCLVLAGEKGCGKSLAQQLITEVLGGRFARPYSYMAGKTEFNADMFTAEHLAIEDDVPSTKLADRRSFGAKIKEVTANQGQRLHAKGRDALILPVFWRITVSVNDEPENLMILPPIDESLTDKLILTRTRTATLPCSTQSDEGRDKCWQTLTSELPAFLAWLKAWQIPGEFQSGRYGVKEYHHPEIMVTLAELSPEAKLAQLIDTALFSEAIKVSWTGTATELESLLTGHSATAYEARRLLSFNTATGVYLSRLAVKSPDRYERKHTNAGNEWLIKPARIVKGVKGFYDLKSKHNNIEIGAADADSKNVENSEKPFTPFTIPTEKNPSFDFDDDDELNGETGSTLIEC